MVEKGVSLKTSVLWVHPSQTLQQLPQLTSLAINVQARNLLFGLTKYTTTTQRMF